MLFSVTLFVHRPGDATLRLHLVVRLPSVLDFCWILRVPHNLHVARLIHDGEAVLAGIKLHRLFKLRFDAPFHMYPPLVEMKKPGKSQASCVTTSYAEKTRLLDRDDVWR